MKFELSLTELRTTLETSSDHAYDGLHSISGSVFDPNFGYLTQRRIIHLLIFMVYLMMLPIAQIIHHGVE
jgi:hypothetical protein